MVSEQEKLMEEKAEARRNKICAAGFCVVFAVAITVGLAVYYTRPPPPPPSLPEPLQPRQEVIASCHIMVNQTKSKCESLGCVWRNMDEKGAPKCQFPAGYGYKLVGDPIETDLGVDYVLSRTDSKPLYENVIQTVLLQVEFLSESILRLKFKDNNTERFEIPETALPIDQPDAAVPDADRKYNISITMEPQFGVVIIRRDTGVVVFNTSLPGMVMADQFLQMTTRLPTEYVYGFGEHNHRRLLHDMNWKTWSIFTRDVAPVDAWNLYGAQPFYMNLEKDGKASGVFLRNSNAMDLLLQPEPHPAITYRVIGGVLDFFVFLGDSPENVVQLYTHTVGRPLMPPYWSLGFQLSRWHYGNLSVVKEVVDRNRKAGIPQDVQFGDIDYMFKKIDFTVDKDTYADLPEFVDDLHSMGQKYIVILDHALGANETILMEAKNNSPGFDAYQDGLNKGIYVKHWNNSNPIYAEVWPGLSVYPDFTNDASQGWWSKWCGFLYENESIAYDGLWIDMNEPSSFVPGSIDGCRENKWNYPPYVPKVLGAQEDGKLFDKTICMDSIQAIGKHYDAHSLYGHYMAMRTYRTLEERFPDKRPFAMTRSNFAGTQKYAIHWLGDNQSRWEQIPWSIIAMLEYSIFGFSMTGADVCGFWYATDEEMCTRWSQLGAFYPYSRNHNAKGFPDQDPAAFSDVMVSSTRSILMTRYKFLPFLYTLMHHAHVKGSTVARPLFFEFPTDMTTYAVDRQFMWGSALMISPAMNRGQTKVDAYFPKARWYNYFTGEEVQGTGKHHILDTPLDKINVHMKGGTIIPWQEPENTTVYSRERPMGLLVALDESQKASGDLFWDDGESKDTYEMGKYLYLKFSVSGMELRTQVVNNNYTIANELYFKTIDLFGLSQRPNRVLVDRVRLSSQHITNYNGHSKGFQITNQMLNITQPHTISWQLF
ncbi:maltase-glucoamylase-like isoform X2 [Liolophura sinensis]|uniref:maltase-glucoamylase-like isoform X2 n=1 Tax=Liolophura sinensis TaxID=3198878 RepID=UPI003158B2A0